MEPSEVSVTPCDDDRGMTSITIDCADCRMRETSACEGCVVSFIWGREPGDAVVIDIAEERAIRMLERGGLVPPLLHEAKAQ